MFFISVSNIQICFGIYGTLFYEEKKEINDQVVLKILSQALLSQDNYNNSSKYSPILGYLIL